MRRVRIAKTSIVLAESLVLILAALAEQAHHCERSRGIIMNNTLAELVSQRRARIDSFNANPPNDEFEAFDISVMGDTIERTPIGSKADALAALGLIRDEAVEPGQHLIHHVAMALRRYIEKQL